MRRWQDHRAHWRRGPSFTWFPPWIRELMCPFCHLLWQYFLVLSVWTWQCPFLSHLVFFKLRWYDNSANGNGIQLRQSLNVDRLDKFKDWLFKLSCAAPGRSSYYFSIYLYFHLPCAHIWAPYQFTNPIYVASSDAVLWVQQRHWYSFECPLG